VIHEFGYRRACIPVTETEGLRERGGGGHFRSVDGSCFFLGGGEGVRSN
jgi:hypothetical protein